MWAQKMKINASYVVGGFPLCPQHPGRYRWLESIPTSKLGRPSAPREERRIALDVLGERVFGERTESRCGTGPTGTSANKNVNGNET